ncbi:hypothetical protein KRR55_17935 [Paeniglutamicibacter sp. ABSL32-1]|uniref:hypothetical protein n=1 Tax=Paeniglutamicibacter quisquiliarum TaxID=2849498 RepID=UPI001C2D718D|nr:hypothetical protein [Paeniglutamicibacter quisquiliarum]MBV1780996.1 hypothetical protein [Paeniglutamicibacter quisquiliarum]
MTRASKLVTLADLDYSSADKSRVSVAARLGLLLEDGSSVLLLDNRGWSTSQRWSDASVDDIEETAFGVVGPDAPAEDQDDEEMATEYWESLSEILEQRDLDIGPAELRELPHEVRLSQRLLKRIDAAIQDLNGRDRGL